jgi:U1 small nuclear ribonucleoprotein
MNRMNTGRKMTPKGQMSSSGSGPAIMMMPSHVRATFMPDPPLRHIPPPKRRRPKTHPSEEGTTKSKRSITGVAAYMQHFEQGKAPDRTLKSTPKSLKKMRAKKREEKMKHVLKPLIEDYRKDQRECSGEYQGMNCYNTLFVGRLAYEVTEGKLLREFEAFGPVKDLKLITVKNNGGTDGTGGTDGNDGNGSHNKTGKSRGYAFVEFEQEEYMKRAYRGADSMRIEGRPIVVDVERGHTVPNWLPRRLGGGLGGTRLGGTDVNVKAPGRFNPNAPRQVEQSSGMMGGQGGPPGGHGYGHAHDGHGYGHGYGPPPGRGGPGGGMYGHRDGPPGHFNNQRGPPPGYYNGRGGGGGGGGGPPPHMHNGYQRGGPPPPHGHYNDHHGPPRDRGMKRGRDYGPPPDRRDRRRY